MLLDLDPQLKLSARKSTVRMNQSARKQTLTPSARFDPHLHLEYLFDTSKKTQESALGRFDQ